VAFFEMSSSFQQELLNFVTSVMTPNHIHPWAIYIFNFALIGLVLTLSAVILIGAGNIHHVIMLIMSVVLFVAVHWFLQAVAALPASPKSKKQQ
jgi:hypothetical protein